MNNTECFNVTDEEIDQAVAKALETLASKEPSNEDLREASILRYCPPSPEQRQILTANLPRHLEVYRSFPENSLWSYIYLYNAYCAEDDMSHLLLFLRESDTLKTWQLVAQLLIDRLTRKPEAVISERVTQRMLTLLEEWFDYKTHMDTSTNKNFAMNLVMFFFLLQPTNRLLVLMSLAPKDWGFFAHRIRWVAESREKLGIPTEDLRGYEKRLLESYEGRKKDMEK